MHVLRELDYDAHKKYIPKTTYKDRQIKENTKTYATKQLFGNKAVPFAV